MTAIPLVFVLERALRDVGIRVDGVSVGDPEDRSTWRAFYQPSTTVLQRAQGDALLLSLDPQDVATLTNIKTDLSVTRVDDDLMKSVIQALFEAIPAPTVTLPQLRARILQLYRARL